MGRAEIIACAVVSAVLGCTRPNYVQCSDNTSCEYIPGGICTLNPATGHQWCSVADPSCPSGLRWDDTVVGDGLSGMCVDGSPVDGPRACPQGRVVFSTDRDGDHEIAVADADGGSVQLLTQNLYRDSKPKWSPDGSKIAWEAYPAGAPEVFVMGSDGSNPINLSRGAGNIGMYPLWSPDGTRLAFETSAEVYLVNTDGTGLIRLTTHAGEDTPTSWAPDGSKILFNRSTPSFTDYEVYVMDADGSGQTNLTNAASSDDSYAQWPSSGAKVAFISGRTGNQDIWLMNLDGTSQMNLTSSPRADGIPVWSPDGSKLAYDYYLAAGDYEIWTMTATGAGKSNLTNNPALDYDPRWSPDGGHLLFTSERDGNPEVYSMSANGSMVTNITNNSADDREAAWIACP